jgi:hypothetical protein
MLGGVIASAAQAAALSKSTAVAAATAKAKALAKGSATAAPGKASRVHCARKSTKRFRCTTTVKGSARCDDGGAGCAEAAPFEIPYVITVRLVGSKLRVTATQA